MEPRIVLLREFELRCVGSIHGGESLSERQCCWLTVLSQQNDWLTKTYLCSTAPLRVGDVDCPDLSQRLLVADRQIGCRDYRT